MIGSQNIYTNTLVSQFPGSIVSDMDGEKVMLSISKGKYYNLGEIGGRIWELIEQPISIEEIVIRLLEEYDVKKTECEEQVINFIDMLRKEELVELKN
ncbi:lasso peptide biosynthesis PqqD family chaperone [Evansella clarkii]|uniref:lasso peptide biosynthesis PqqD family chaperone n=1 Tax=Evansella clarkii TaxID=79879 RepID=UPI000996C924|nr:lasso peptide biosynthesis PqqD family chaperone [Evansella clarkii]